MQIYPQPDRRTESIAGFAQIDYPLLETTNLTLGYRHTFDKKQDDGGTSYAFWSPNAGFYNGMHVPPNQGRAHQSNNLTFGVGSEAPLGAVGEMSMPSSATKRWNKGTWRLGADHRLEKGSMVFGSVATGYKMGGMAEWTDVCNNGCMSFLPYQPEDVITYELGYKGRLFRNHFNFTATTFLSNYTNMQHTGMKVVGTDMDPNSPMRGEPVLRWATDNANSSRIAGVELEYDSIPWAGARLFGFVSLMRARLGNTDQVGDGYMCRERAGIPELPGQTPCADGNVDLSGNHLINAPDWAFAINYEHAIPIGSTLTLVPNVGVRAQEFMFLDWLNYDAPSLSQKQPRYAKFNGNLRLMHSQWDHGWRLAGVRAGGVVGMAGV